MKKVVELIKKVSPVGWFMTVFLYGFECLMYLLGPELSTCTGTYKWAIAPKIPFIDDNIPLVKVFVIIYVVSFAFWAIYMLIISTTDSRNYINFIISYMITAFIGFLFFLFMPTYIDRSAEGVLAAVEGPGLINWGLRVVYASDGWDVGWSLFPSFHCYISMFCYLGIRNCSYIGRKLKVFALVSTVLICLSTVFTKQHYFMDIVGGVGIATICHVIVCRLDPGTRIVGKYLPGQDRL